MTKRALSFGVVAGVYDEVRPGYPDELVSAVLGYVGGPVRQAVEVGAGTGVGTRAFVARGVPVLCVEADPQMAAVLAARFSGTPSVRVRVRVSRFEDWVPSPGGVPLLFCAQAWHWMPADRRCALAYAALEPGGVVALFSHKYRFADPVLEAAVLAAYGRCAPEWVDGDLFRGAVVAPDDHWFTRDLVDSGLFVGVEACRFDRTVRFERDRYLALVSTFSSFQVLPSQRRAVVLEVLGRAVDGHGGVVDVRLDTVLAMGRRPTG